MEPDVIFHQENIYFFIKQTQFLNIESYVAQYVLLGDKQTTGANAASKMERGLDVLGAHYSCVFSQQQQLMMVLSNAKPVSISRI